MHANARGNARENDHGKPWVLADYTLGLCECPCYPAELLRAPARDVARHRITSRDIVWAPALEPIKVTGWEKVVQTKRVNRGAGATDAIRKYPGT